MSQFAEDVAHELRTPIQNMMGEAEVTLSAERKPEEYRSILESNLEEFERLSRMINEMLFLARAENPQQQIERMRLDARREIEAVRDFFDALTESRGVTITAHGQGDIDADPLLFRRAMTNLLSNALRHTPSGGRIVLSVDKADDSAVLVKVTDSGCGIRARALAEGLRSPVLRGSHQWPVVGAIRVGTFDRQIHRRASWRFNRDRQRAGQGHDRSDALPAAHARRSISGTSFRTDAAFSSCGETPPG